MKKICSALALLFAVSILPLWLKAQEDNLKTLNEIATTYYERQAAAVKPVIWIHTDRHVYSPGQTLWFSLSLVQEENHRPFRLEKTLHVVLTNGKNEVLQQLKLYTSGPVLSGSMHLPDTLQEGNYLLTAFTPGMKETNRYRAGFQPLLVLKQKSNFFSEPVPPRSMPVPAGFRFNSVVEGGHLISGVMNRVVFTCFDAAGAPVSASGRITNSIDTQVIRFQTGLTGIGQALLPAVRNRKYTAIISHEGKEYSTILLPSPPIAWQVSVTGRSSNSIKVRVSLSDSLYKLKPVSYLLVFAAGKVQFAANGKGMYEADIPLQQLPHGIATIALYNEKKEQVSSRRIFIQEEAVSFNLSTNMTYWSAREYVKLNLKLADRQNKPVSSRVSVSVTDLSYTAPDPQPETSLYQLVLQPWWADKKIGAKAFTELTQNPEWLDLLMISEPATNGIPYQIQSQSTDTLRGTVRNKKGQQQAGLALTLFTSQGSSLVLTDTTDEAGQFAFPLPDMMGSARFNFQIRKNGSVLKDMVLKMDSSLTPEVPEFRNFLEPDASRWLQEARTYWEGTHASFYSTTVAEELPPVEVSHVKTDFTELIARKRVHKGSWIATPELIDQTPDGSLANVVLSAPGVSLMGGFLVIQGGMRNISGAVTVKSEPLVVVNGVQMNLGSDLGQLGMNLNISPVMNFINTFSNRNVEFIEVLTGSQAAQYGTVGASGVILINTSATVRTGVTEKNESGDLHQYFREGYHIPQGFPSPDYFEKTKKGPDQRITLYWNGDLNTDAEGKLLISFFTSDHAGPFLVTVQGIAADGSLFRKEMILNKR